MIKDRAYGIIPFIFQDNKWQVFLILQQKGHWAFPKGHAHPDESAKVAATREFQEETGLQVEKFLLNESISEEYVFTEGKRKVFKTVFYFPALVTGKPQLQEEEVADGRWFDFPSAMKQLTYNESKVTFQRTIDALQEVLRHV